MKAKTDEKKQEMTVFTQKADSDAEKKKQAEEKAKADAKAKLVEQKENEQKARSELTHREDSAGIKVEVSSLDDSFITEP